MVRLCASFFAYLLVVFTVLTSSVVSQENSLASYEWRLMARDLTSKSADPMNDAILASENHVATVEFCLRLLFGNLSSTNETISSRKLMAKLGFVAQCIIIADTIVAPYNVFIDMKRTLREFDWNTNGLHKKMDHLMSLPVALLKSAARLPLSTLAKLGQIYTWGVFYLVGQANFNTNS